MLEKWTSRLEKGQTLSQTESFTCLQTLFNSNDTDEDAYKLLQLLNHNEQNVDTLIGFSKAVQDVMVTVDLPEHCIDVCGTGGSGKNRFNVSTASAFLSASIGLKVAKHGNRGSKQANGSFDFLEALDIPFGQSTQELENMIRKYGLCFIFARHHHPKLAKVAQARKRIGTKTIFNMIGPLCNPGKLDYQVIGTTNNDTARLMASAKHKLGTKKSIILVGANGLDELSSTGPSKLLTVSTNEIMEEEIDPKNYGFKRRSDNEIEGQSAKENAKLFKTLLTTKDINHPISELIILNTALACICANHTKNFEEGLQLATSHFESDKLIEFFESFQNVD